MNLKNILSKTDFKVGNDCPTKLYYRKMNYSSSKENNEYLEYLAEGGYAVGKMATLYFEEGIRIDNSTGVEQAIKQTQVELQKDSCILFEAAFKSGNKLGVIDILIKEKGCIQLIEVKSKGYDPAKKIESQWKELIPDIAFQKIIVEELYPNHKIECYVLAPDKSKSTSIEGLNSMFKLIDFKTKNGFNFFDIVYEGSKYKLLEDQLLTKVSVDDAINKKIQGLRQDLENLEKSISPEIKKIKTKISKKCFDCEYEHSGKKECWAHMPTSKTALEDLYHIGTIKITKTPLVNQLIEEKKSSIFDVPLEALKGKRGERQLLQIEHTKSNTEWFGPELSGTINSWKYPLHFIDFETSTSALPFHKGMKPYEMSAFQWSCHTIPYEGAEPLHTEWLNLEPTFPGFKFAESLMAQIGTTGTTLMWSSHENTTLRNIYKQMDKYKYNNPALREWLEIIVKFNAEDSGALVDMNELCKEQYFHPYMKGRTSIKWTLPAVLKSNKSKRTIDWLKNFSTSINLLSLDKENYIEDPYKNLPSIDILEHAETVNEGTGAMRAYEDMLFGKAKEDKTLKAEYEIALRNYCKLDTLAMLIIWEHWK